MITDAERTRLQKLFSDTLSVLCHSGLPGGCAHRVDALIGVTLDTNEVILVNVNENFGRTDECCPTKINGGKNSNTLPVQLPEIANTFSYGKKTEYVAEHASEVLHNGIADDGTDEAAASLRSGSLSFNEYMESQETKSVDDEGLGISGIVSEPGKTFAKESDSDCFVVKTEPNDSPPEDVNFIAASDIDVPSVPDVQGSLSMRMRHVPIERRQARWSFYGHRHLRPQPRCNTNEHAHQLTVVGSNMSSSLHLNTDVDELPPSGSASNDVDRCATTSRELLQCYMCGAWLRGRQTLNEHIRGLHLSIYDKHCKYCGLSFKWRSALRRHRLSCSISQTQ